jgi:uncharacterized protein
MKVVQLLILILLTLNSVHAQNHSVLIIAGGHSYDTLSFSSMFDQMEGLNYDFMLQPEANRYLASLDILPYSLLIFYDMWNPISEEEKSAYLRFTEKGTPMLFLHHALVSYQEWPEFEKIIGGKYIQTFKNETRAKSELSTYKHDVWIDVEVVDPAHPVTFEMENFRLFDEVYGNYRVGEKVTPLLKTNHPESTPVIAWENSYNNSKIIYIQPGHDKNAYNDKNYRKLIYQAIKYLQSTN